MKGQGPGARPGRRRRRPWPAIATALNRARGNRHEPPQNSNPSPGGSTPALEPLGERPAVGILGGWHHPGGRAPTFASAMALRCRSFLAVPAWAWKNPRSAMSPQESIGLVADRGSSYPGQLGQHLLYRPDSREHLRGDGRAAASAMPRAVGGCLSGLAAGRGQVERGGVWGQESRGASRAVEPPPGPLVHPQPPQSADTLCPPFHVETPIKVGTAECSRWKALAGLCGPAPPRPAAPTEARRRAPPSAQRS